VGSGCQDATLIITVPGFDPEMDGGPASAQHLRAFVQISKHLLEPVKQRFGEHDVDALLRHFAQEWIATFGVVNRALFLAGAAANGSGPTGNPNMHPFTPDTDVLPPRQPNSSYRILTGTVNVNGNNLTPFVHGTDYAAVMSARMQLAEELTAVRRTLHGVRVEADCLRTKLAESEDDAAACRVEIQSLLDDRAKLTQAVTDLTIERDSLAKDCGNARASISQLTAQLESLRFTHASLRDQNVSLGRQLESIANSAVDFQREADAILQSLKDERDSYHKRSLRLSMDIAYTQAEAVEMANHDGCMEEGGLPYVPPTIESVPDPSVDIGPASFTGGALLQLARRVRAQATTKRITQSLIDEHFERGVPVKPVDSPLPPIIAQVLDEHTQPDYVAAVISSTLSLPRARFRDMYDLLRIEAGSPLEQDLTEAIKKALGIDFLP
jgi:hypothetical protein